MNQWPVYNDSIDTLQNDTTENSYISNTTGMQGQPLPYKLYSDGGVISVLAIGFLLIVIAMQNDNKSIWRLFKNCIITPGRNTLFDNGNNQIYALPTLLLGVTTTIMCGLVTYHYYSYSSPDDFACIANRPLMLVVYSMVFFLFLIAKWIAYTIVDWIFFDREKRRLWHKTFLNIISVIGLVLFASSVFMVFLDTEFHFAHIIILVVIVLSKILLFYNCIKYFFHHYYGTLHLILYFCTLEIIPDMVLWKCIGLVNSILF